MKISTEKNGKASILKSVGIFSASLLTMAFAIYLYSPVVGTNATDSGSADVNLRVTEVMSLVLNAGSLNLTTSPYSFVSDTISATASTNSQYGYTLTLEDTDNNSSLVHTNENIDETLTSGFSGSKTSSTMDENTWGFSLNSTDYYKIPVYGSPVAIKRTNTKMSTSNESTAVDFGAKVGNIASGIYTDTILFTIYVNGQDGKPTNPSDPDNPPDDPGEPGEEYLQSFECRILENIGDSMQLVDKRDGNVYTVKKLKDGKCWMTENLRIAGPIVLKPSDSDVSENYTLPASSLQSFNTSSFYQSGVYIVGGVYGGLYNFYAATAGTGGNNTAGEAPSSICPKGWKLPTIGVGSDFEGLYNQYPSSAELRGEPGFVMSGWINGGYYYHQDDEGWYWSSKKGDSAYLFMVRPSQVNPYQNYGKLFGISVRCISRN